MSAGIGEPALSEAWRSSGERLPAVNEQYALGQVRSSAGVDPTTLGLRPELIPAAVTAVVIYDPYVDRYPDAQVEQFAAEELELSKYAEHRHHIGAWHRAPETVYYDTDGVAKVKQVWGDPESRRVFLRELQSPAFEAWTTLIPSSRALTYLAGPTVHSSVQAADGTIVLGIDDRAREWWSLSTDAKAVRSRAAVMAHTIKQSADRRLAAGEVDHDLRWMSVACGTALPAMKAALHAGLRPQLMLLDLDREAMSSTRAIAADIGFEGEITEHRVNIFAPRRLAELGKRLDANGGRPEFIDLMGIFEYTGHALGVDPVTFLHSNYDLLAPGGRLVFGQMRAGRPVASLFTGVIGWPTLQMRTPAEFMQIIHDAGIPVAATELYLPSDGVYMVGVIDKPSAEQLDVIDLREPSAARDGQL